MTAGNEFVIRKYEVHSALARKMEKYLHWMLEHDFSKYTVESRWYQLRYFLRWCEERGLKSPEEISRQLVERYQRHLYHQKKKNGEPLNNITRQDLLVTVKTFFRYLAKTRQLIYNPAADLEMPKVGVRLPRHILTVSEVEQVLNAINISAPMALRDRAIIEVLYSTGLRRMEVTRLKVRDIDMNRGWLSVIEGKGKKDRVVPIGDRALTWLEKYMWEQRPLLVSNPLEDVLFLTKQGKPLRPKLLTCIALRHVRNAGINKPGSCHLFRHTMATLMLEGGADVRFIQEMLGHSKLETTQIYTKVAIGKLKDVHNKTHPGAHLKPKNSGEKPEPEETPDKWLLPGQTAQKKP
jgi:integrase/recombinase XerD